MTSVHHLQSKLKALKLGGMLLTLETRLAQAQREPLGFLDFLEMLLEDELERRANKRLATCSFVQQRNSVIVCGPVGAGKTHIAEALGYEACKRGYGVLFTKTSHLLRDLGGGRADGTWEQRFRRLWMPSPGSGARNS